jgi:hypothetical protein
MARRRELPERDTAAELAQVPLRLRRFDPDEWERQPEPEWWRDDGAVMPYHYFKARLTWMRARRAWAAEHGVDIEQLFERHVAETQASARNLEELNEPYAGDLFVADEQPDPRLSPFGENGA